MNILKDIIALVQTDTAGIIVAIATLVTALASAIVLLINAIRAKRIENKVDTSAKVQTEIHSAVNGGKALLLAEIVALKAQIVQLTNLPSSNK